MDYQNMTADEYIEQRIHVQQKYHSKKASKMKKRFISSSIIVLISSATIPIITYLIDIIPLTAKILIAVMSGISTVITGYLSLSKVQELFVEYRIISEKLKSVEFLYKTKAPPFNNENAFSNLVSVCEDILYSGNDKWYSAFTESQSKQA